MRIATKPVLFFGGVVVLFCILAAALTTRLNDISKTIIGLAVPVLGTDEFGQLGESMRGVSAAIEELMKMASAADAVRSL